MKYKDFIDELTSLGVKVVDGKKHLKLYFNNKQTTCKRHPTQEVSKKHRLDVLKQLGLKK